MIPAVDKGSGSEAWPLWLAIAPALTAAGAAVGLADGERRSAFTVAILVGAVVLLAVLFAQRRWSRRALRR